MTSRLWVAYVTDKFEQTVAFYAEGLGLSQMEAWHRGAHDRGMTFAAANGVIEIRARPDEPYNGHMDVRPVQGLTVGLEIEDVDAWYGRATSRGLPIRVDIADFEWGERGFSVVDPNGVVIYIFAVTY